MPALCALSCRDIESMQYQLYVQLWLKVLSSMHSQKERWRGREVVTRCGGLPTIDSACSHKASTSLRFGPYQQPASVPILKVQMQMHPTRTYVQLPFFGPTTVGGRT